MSDPTIRGMQPGQRLLNRYELIKHIARGGMADVWEATDTLLGRRVAIKALHSQFSTDEAFIRRFRREAQAAANLSHPNIVSIFDWGEEDNSYFIVMELVEGRSLRDVLRSNDRLLPRRAAEIAAESAAALAIAHRAGLVHRDIKPGNILLAEDGTVKVTDFGIALAWDDSAQLTRTGAVIGTATYFSPEQAQGQALDERSDIYSLGVVLYEMLTGQPPFSGESPVAVAYQHVQEPAALPSSGNPDIDPGLERIVMRAMDKVPEARYQSALELREDLLRYLRGDKPTAAQAAYGDDHTRVLEPMPAPTVPPDETYRQVAAQPSARSNLGFIATTAFLVLTLVVLLVILFQNVFGGSDTPETVSVPAVVGFTEGAAVTAIRNASLTESITRTAHESVPAGIVVSTDPVEGTEVDAGSIVTVVVSTGQDEALVPSLVGETLDEAIRRLTEAGLELGEVTEETTDEEEAGTVLEQSPAPNTPLPPGSTVDLTVAVEPDQFLLEDLRGRSFRDVEFVLTEAGMTVQRQDEFDDEVPEGLVIETIPGPGLIDIGTTITVLVSLGPEEVEVPSLIGRSVEEARTLLEPLGLELVESTATVVDPDLAGRIAEQFPDAGTKLLPGARVLVTLAVAPPPTTTTTTTTVPPTTTTTLPPGP